MSAAWSHHASYRCSRSMFATSVPVNGFTPLVALSGVSSGVISEILPHTRTPPAAESGRLPRHNRRHHMRSDGFAASNRVYAFVCFRLEMNFLHRHAQRACQCFSHLRKMRAEFRFLGNHHGVYVLDCKILFCEQLSGVLQKN